MNYTGFCFCSRSRLHQLFLFGQFKFTIPMAIITLIWGIIAGIGANINQYWIMSSAPEAANLGTTIGAAAPVIAHQLLLHFDRPQLHQSDDTQL